MNINKIIFLFSFYLILCIESKDLITVSVASVARREKLLEKTVTSILPQTDILHVFLNNYQHIPDFLKNQKIHIARSQDFQDFGSNAKFFWAEYVEGYHFIIDDDILYPDDYLKTLIDSIEYYKRKVIVGIHGIIFHKVVRDFYKDRTVYHFSESLKQDTFVNMLGAGTIGFHTETISIKIEDFHSKNMDDIWFAIEAKKKHIPMVSIARQKNYIMPLVDDFISLSIFVQNVNSCDFQTSLINQYMPWDIFIN